MRKGNLGRQLSATLKTAGVYTPSFPEQEVKEFSHAVNTEHPSLRR
jgi:hypothetical protein